jgi:hypothetical protein
MGLLVLGVAAGSLRLRRARRARRLPARAQRKLLAFGEVFGRPERVVVERGRPRTSGLWRLGIAIATAAASATARALVRDLAARRPKSDTSAAARTFYEPSGPATA